jgi:hypothetical protein
MKSVTCIVEAGRVGSNKENSPQIFLEGLGLGKNAEVAVRYNFSGPPIGLAKLVKTPEGVEAAIDFFEDKPIMGWPAIAISVISSVTDENGIRTITACEIADISISSSPNADPFIKPIGF